MRILALDTTGLTASAAIVNDEKILAEIITDCERNHSETILPMISDVFERTELTVCDIDYIACASGPGSFTGLRIGAATAKGLAFGQGKKIIPVPTLDSMAYNIIKSDAVIVPLLDARREQAYTAFYSWDGRGLNRISEYMCEDINAIISSLKLFPERNVIFLGDGVPVFKDVISRSGINFYFAPPHTQRNHASSVASLAIEFVKKGKAVEPDDFELFYIRKPQAERELECRMKK